MSNGQITNNVATAVDLLVQLLVQAGTIATTIQTAQAAGVDITDDQLDTMTAAAQGSIDTLQADINKVKSAQGNLPLGNG